MKRLIPRSVSFLLIACLLADSGLAQGFQNVFHNSSLQTSSFYSPESIFQEEALAGIGLWIERTAEKVKAASSSVRRAAVSLPGARKLSNRYGWNPTIEDHPNPHYVAKKIAIQEPDGTLKDLDEVMRDYIRQLFPQESGREKVRQSVFQHFNGIGLIPLLFVLSTHPGPQGISMLRYIEQNKNVTLAELAHAYNPEDAEANKGAKYVYLRGLAILKWLIINQDHGINDATAYSGLTPLGKKVLELAEKHRDVLEKAARSYAHSQNYYRLFRKPLLNLNEKKALGEYRHLIALSQKRWIPDAPADDPLAQEAIDELRMALDGVIMSPTVIALGMPDYQEHKGLLKEIHPAFYSQDRSTLNLDVREPHNVEFLSAAFELLASQRPFEESLGSVKDRSFVFTSSGQDYMRLRGSFGTPASYIRGQRYRLFEKQLFDSQDPDATDTLHYQHVDPIVNAWGTGLTHGIYHPHLQRALLPMVQDGARGAAEMGAGSGKIIAMASAVAAGWRLILDRYDRELVSRGLSPLKPRPTGPFWAIGSDITDTALKRTSDRLIRWFKGRRDVRFITLRGDISYPRKFAEDVKRETGLDSKDLLYLLMFVIEERNWAGLTPADAERILNASVRHVASDPVGRQELLNLLREMQVVSNDADLPAGDELVTLVRKQFNTPMNDRGRLVPAEVAAAELILFMSEFTTVNPKGIIALDVCTPTLDQLSWWVGAQLYLSYYLTHHGQREKTLPEQQRRLGYLLGGYRAIENKPIPHKGKGPGGRGVPAVALSVLEKLPTFPMSASEFRPVDGEKNSKGVQVLAALRSQVLFWIGMATLATLMRGVGIAGSGLVFLAPMFLLQPRSSRLRRPARQESLTRQAA